MKVATEPLLTLKNFIHFGCKCIPTGRGKDGKIEVLMIYCPHLKEDRKLLITRADI